MKRWKDLSLRFKVPLFTTFVIFLVGGIITASLLVSVYTVFKRDLLLSSSNMGRILGHTLIPAMLHDDLWKAYEVINTPFSIEPGENALQPSAVLVLNHENQVYVSTNPSQYPLLKDPSNGDPEISKLLDRIRRNSDLSHFYDERRGFNSLYIVTPLESDNTLLGTLIMIYPKEIFINRFLSFIRLATVVTLIIIACLLPVGAILGRRAAAPLVELSHCMGRVGQSLPDRLDCDAYSYRSQDELGELWRQFVAMVAELREKATLEQQMLIAERMAAIGRFTAGIAHEINNPLGGLLNATNTLKRHGNNDPMTQKTVSLIERGLFQIRDIVGALLVEASPETHPLTPQDIQDSLTLVQQEARERQVHIEWNNHVTDEIPIASTLIRQVLINLLLNAIQATPINGCIHCRIETQQPLLFITIINSGKPISEQQMVHLFEPFSTESEDGTGLGLWVTYQIVEKLNGDIQVSSNDTLTEFVVTLPYQEAA